MRYLVIAPHRSEYPDPLELFQYEALTVGERNEGPEGWDNWIFCSTSRHSGGWVPEQIIERLPGDAGRALEDYSAREINVDPGDQVLGERTLNAWCWCRRPLDGASGWVPLANLAPLPDHTPAESCST